MTRYKDRHFRRGQADRSQSNAGQPSRPIAGVDTSRSRQRQRPRLVKTKQFRYKPMYSDEAIEQMELLDHDFLRFYGCQPTAGQCRVPAQRRRLRVDRARPGGRSIGSTAHARIDNAEAMVR